MISKTSNTKLQTLTKQPKASWLPEINQQGANALLAVTFEFLRRNHIPEQLMIDFSRTYSVRRPGRKGARLYGELIRAYENMGVIMATWFSDPKFLDSSGNPVRLSQGRGRASIGSLVRASGSRVETSVALKLMRQSPSIRFNRDGDLTAVRRVFVLPELEVPRAAFVVERYLNTLQRNASARKNQSTLLLERSCHVSEVDLTTIAPLLRDIEGRGTAFMDSIDGEMEMRRLRRTTRKAIGEMGVLVFAWTRPVKASSRRSSQQPIPASKSQRKHAVTKIIGRKL
jgi:hypothetical protein